MGDEPDVWSSSTTGGHPSDEINTLGHCRVWLGAALGVAKQSSLRFTGTGDQLWRVHRRREFASGLPLRSFSPPLLA